VTALLAAIARHRPGSTPTPSPTPQVTHLGVTLTPKSFSLTDYLAFFTQAKTAGDTVTWAGDWHDITKPSGAPVTVIKQAKQNGLTPIIETTFFTTTNGKATLLDPLDPTTLAAYQDALVQFARTYQPPYLGVGIEVNRLASSSPADFATFVTFFNQVAPAIKAVSAQTQVFTVFQLENLKGRGDGLFGGTVTSPQWSELDQFLQADMIGFTTYPGLIYKDPAEIPNDYYQEITFHTHKPILFTEIGWPSQSVTGWESSEAEQAAYVTRFFLLTESLHPRYAIWAFLYDQDIPKPFNDYGFITTSGAQKQSFAIWQSYK
jgi:hypothetical protein